MRLFFLIMLTGLLSWAGLLQAAPACAQSLQVPVYTLQEADLAQGQALNTHWHFTGPDGSEHLLKVPGGWEKAYGRLWPKFGRGVYQLQLRLPEAALQHNLKFYNELMAGTSFRLYANDRLVGHNGLTLGSHSRVSQFIVFQVSQTELALRLEIDNQTLQWSGLVRPLWLGYNKSIVRKDYRHSLEFNLFFGAFCFMAFFHGLLFLFFRRDNTVIWFGLLCVCIVVYMEFFRMHNLEIVFGDIPLEWNIKVLRLALYTLVPCFFWYARALSPDYLPRRAALLVSWVSLGFMLTLLLPGRLHTPLIFFWFIFFSLCLIYQLFLMLRLSRRWDLAPFVYSVLFFSLITANDMLNALNIIKTGFYGRFGFLAFCFTQTGFVAWRLQKNYRDSLRLQQDLLSINQNLEYLVTERTQEIENKNEQLNQLMDFKEDMINMMVHDLKAPLNALSQPLQPGQEDQRQAASARIQLLIHQMLEVQQSDELALELTLQPVQLNLLCQKVIQWMQPWALSKHLLLSNLLTSDSLVLVDAPLFERVIQNLLDNAIRHAFQGSEIQIRAEQNAHTLTLCVANPDPGLSPEQKIQVLQKGVSLKQTNAESSLGLGLYFCQQVSQAHGGQLWLSDHPRGGVCVSIQLQRIVAAPQQDFSWSAQDLALLKPSLLALQALDVYQITELSSIMEELRQIQTSKTIQAWVQALETAIQEVHETNYRQLIENIPPSADCG